MRVAGIFLIVAVAALFSFDRIKRARHSLLVLEELYRFIECMRVEIGCYLRPISQIPKSFSSDILFKMGFFEDAERFGLFDAYLRLEKKMDSAEEEKKILGRFFSIVGRGYAEDEIKLIDGTAAQLSPLLLKKRAEAPTHKKLVLTLSSAVASALIILLI